MPPNEKILEKVQTCGYDLVAFYTDAVENNALISFFNAAGNKAQNPFVKKQNLTRVNEALESIVDECFCVPIWLNSISCSGSDGCSGMRSKKVSKRRYRNGKQKPAEREQPLPIQNRTGTEVNALWHRKLPSNR